MAWNHRGTEIDMRGASFCAEVEGKNISLSSLNAVKKAIDKHLDMKAKEVELKLPVVIRITKGRYYREGDDKNPDRIIHGVITGLDAEKKSAQGLEIPEGWHTHSVLPDTPQNVAHLQDCIDTEIAEAKAKKAIEGRTVGLSFAGYGRKGNTYSEAVDLLKQNYERAKRGKSDD